MRRRFALLWAPLVLAAALALPSAAGAVQPTAETHRIFIWDNYCTASHGVVFKLRVTAAGWTSVNQLTIDSKSQTNPGLPSWQTHHQWPQVSYTFPVTGAAHSLTLRRHQVNDQFKFVFPLRIVFKLRGWDHGLVAWVETVHSIAC